MSSIQSAMIAMHFTPATQRQDCCRGCKHGEEVRPDRSPPWDKPYWQCNVGGFRTSPMAVCDRHALRHQAGPVVMPGLAASLGAVVQSTKEF